ncbi:MAG: hypothetical protein ACJ76I_06275 [Gaiellaceae bacterium]
MVAAAMLLVAVLPSATQAKVSASAVAPSAIPKLSCVVRGAELLGKKVVATGGCKIGTEPVPAVWSWTAHAADVSGSPCGFGSGQGHGKIYYVPSVPHLPGPGVSSTLPGILQLDYTVRAMRGTQKAQARRVTAFRNAGSRVICGKPPAIVSPAAAAPSACVWGTQPSLDGVSVKAGQVSCPGDGPCSWQSAQPLMQSHYLTYRSEFRCQSGVNGFISIAPQFSVDGGHSFKCQTLINGISSFSAVPAWGQGLLNLQVVVNSWPETGKQYPYNEQNSWQTGWIKLNGQNDPCGDYIY